MACGPSAAQHQCPFSPKSCLTYPDKLRNVTQHKSGLAWSWRQASVSEPQASSPRRPPQSPRDKPSLCQSTALRCALACGAVRRCGTLCSVLSCCGLLCCALLCCAVIASPGCPANIKHHLSYNRPRQCRLSQLTPAADLLGAGPRRSGRALSDLIKPVHTIDASNGAGGLKSHAGGPEWFRLYGRRFHPKDAALERVLDSPLGSELATQQTVAPVVVYTTEHG